MGFALLDLVPVEVLPAAVFAVDFFDVDLLVDLAPVVFFCDDLVVELVPAIFLPFDFRVEPEVRPLPAVAFADELREDELPVEEAL